MGLAAVRNKALGRNTYSVPTCSAVGKGEARRWSRVQVEAHKRDDATVQNAGWPARTEARRTPGRHRTHRRPVAGRA